MFNRSNNLRPCQTVIGSLGATIKRCKSLTFKPLILFDFRCKIHLNGFIPDKGKTTLFSNRGIFLIHRACGKVTRIGIFAANGLMPLLVKLLAILENLTPDFNLALIRNGQQNAIHILCIGGNINAVCAISTSCGTHKFPVVINKGNGCSINFVLKNE